MIIKGSPGILSGPRKGAVRRLGRSTLGETGSSISKLQSAIDAWVAAHPYGSDTGFPTDAQKVAMGYRVDEETMTPIRILAQFGLDTSADAYSAEMLAGMVDHYLSLYQSFYARDLPRNLAIMAENARSKAAAEALVAAQAQEAADRWASYQTQATSAYGESGAEVVAAAAAQEAAFTGYSDDAATRSANALADAAALDAAQAAAAVAAAATAAAQAERQRLEEANYREALRQTELARTAAEAEAARVALAAEAARLAELNRQTTAAANAAKAAADAAAAEQARVQTEAARRAAAEAAALAAAADAASRAADVVVEQSKGIVLDVISDTGTGSLSPIPDGWVMVDYLPDRVVKAVDKAVTVAEKAHTVFTDKEINSAIDESRKQGFSDDDILTGLINNGLTVDEAKRYLDLGLTKIRSAIPGNFVLPALLLGAVFLLRR